MREYKITDKEGNVTYTDSLLSFAKEVGIYYGQFYTALHRSKPTNKGDYKVEWAKGNNRKVKNNDHNTLFKITDPLGIVHIVNSYTEFAKSINVKNNGFRKCLEGKQKKCYGGYTIERITKDELEQEGFKLKDDHSNTRNTTSSSSLEILDIIREDNSHKIKFKNKRGNIHTRKAEIKRVNNMTGVRCDYSGENILFDKLYATCNDGKETYVFSVDKIKELGYEFKMDFQKEKVITQEKFSPELFEEELQNKMDVLVKEIQKAEARVSDLRRMKESLSKSLSQVYNANKMLGQVDKLLERGV